MDIDQGRVLRALPAMLWTALPDGQIDFVSQRWSEYTGVGLSELRGRGWQSAIKPDDLPKLLERWQFILESGEPGDMEARMRRLDGEYRWCLIECNPVRDDAGCIVEWCSIATDVDDLRRAEEALWRRELDFQSVVESMPVPVAVMTPSGEVEGVNKLTLKYFGRTFDELKGWKASDVVHPDDLEHTIAAQLEAHRMGSVYAVESRHRRADGVYHWYSVHGLPIRDPQGTILRWLHLLIDIDDRKRAEEALRESEGYSRLIIDSIPGMVAVFTADGELERVNSQVFDFYGKTLEELKSWGGGEITHPEDLQLAIEVFSKSLKSGEPFEIEVRARRFDGAYRWLQSRGFPLKDANGRIVRWYNLLIDIDERKRAEQALAASGRDLKLIIDTIPALAWSAREDGTAGFLSQHYLDYVGYSAEKAQDWGWTGAVHPDDLPGLAATWQAIMASGKPGEAEARLRRHDGEYRWFLFRVNPLRDEDGNIVQWYGVNTDIEDRKRSEESFRAIVETTPECVKVIARDGEVLRVNSAGAAIAGAPSTDMLVGRSFFDFVAPEHRSQYREFHEKICAGQKGFLEFDIISMQGVRRHMETHAAPMRFADGSIVQLGVARDITARKQVEDQLRRSEAFLAEGQHLARMGNLSWNVESGAIIWSEPLYRIFEFEPGNVVTLDLIASRIHPEDMPLMVDMVERAQRGESNFEYQHRIVLPDRSVKHLHLIAHRARDHDQTEYIGAVLDVTQSRLSEEALEKVRSELAQATRIMSLGVLTASIAHEVNQPLAGIITNAGTCLRMLAADPPNINGARETARRTIRDGNRAADVIARLRALFSKKTATIEPMNLNEAVREVIALSWADLQRRRVVLRAELAGGLPPVGGDRIQLQQVMMNLLRNAADAMNDVDDRPRRLLIRTERDRNDQVRLSVEDSGAGFGPQGAEKLFAAFYTTKSDGMGIGLSVSRSIIESHGGRLWAHPNDGPGVTFSFSIPEYSGDEILAREPDIIGAPATGSAQNAAGIS